MADSGRHRATTMRDAQRSEEESGNQHRATTMRDAQRSEEESGNQAQIAELWVQ
jgi:hypothetical protein